MRTVDQLEARPSRASGDDTVAGPLWNDLAASS
jgi:hypothetical protein